MSLSDISDMSSGEEELLPQQGDNIDEVLGGLVQKKGLVGIQHLWGSTKLESHLNEVNRRLNSGSHQNTSFVGVLEEDPEYKLVVASNAIIHQIDDEISALHRYIADIYGKKFPELESLIPNKIDYVRTVMRIGNEMDMTVVELSDLLPSATVMVVSVTGSTTSGLPLSDSDLADLRNHCDELMHVYEAKTTILRYIEGCMNRIAPNTSALVGTRTAAQLLGLAGGLVALSQVPACNVQVMGQEKKTATGFSNIVNMPHTGMLYQSEIVQSCPQYLRRKALKVLSAKLVLAARVDSYHNAASDASEGQRLKRLVLDKIDKWQEPPKAKTKRALPIPEEKRKSRRGGKRVKRWKERFAMTEVRQQQNRIKITTTEGEYGDSAMGRDLGMLGSSENTGKLRAPVKKEIKQVAKKQKVAGASSGATNGLSSSLVFTPVQGLELVNPNAAQERVREANKKWFDNSSGFLSAVPK